MCNARTVAQSSFNVELSTVEFIRFTVHRNGGCKMTVNVCLFTQFHLTIATGASFHRSTATRSVRRLKAK